MFQAGAEVTTAFTDLHCDVAIILPLPLLHRILLMANDRATWIEGTNRSWSCTGSHW
jgi:hypothetical protein